MSIQSTTGQNSTNPINSFFGQLREYVSSKPTSVRSALDADVMFTLLSNSRRRAILHHVDSATEGITLDEMSTEIAALEENTTVDDVSSKARKRVYVACYQSHLPKLEDHDVVVVEEGEKVIKPAENLPALLTALEKTSELVRY